MRRNCFCSSHQFLLQQPFGSNFQYSLLHRMLKPFFTIIITMKLRIFVCEQQKFRQKKKQKQFQFSEYRSTFELKFHCIIIIIIDFAHCADDVENVKDGIHMYRNENDYHFTTSREPHFKSAPLGYWLFLSRSCTHV